VNFSFSAAIATIIKWFHDLTMNHDERISALEANAGIQPAPRPEVPPEVAAHVDAANSGPVGIDYSRYAKDSPFTIQTQRFPGGLPTGWDWGEWAKVSGQPDPRTHTAGGGAIAEQSGPSLFTDGIVRYLHHTEVRGPAAQISTESLTGPTRLSLTYTSQDPGHGAPTQAWVSENGGPEQGPLQLGVEASVPLAAMSGSVHLSVRLDTDGRVIAQLFKTA